MPGNAIGGEGALASAADGTLTGKVALVTGGSNGIGAAAVRMLAVAGASVVVGYNNGLDRAKALIESLPDGTRVHTWGDVSPSGKMIVGRNVEYLVRVFTATWYENFRIACDGLPIESDPTVAIL